jgi:hypothetical protein
MPLDKLPFATYRCLKTNPPAMPRFTSCRPLPGTLAPAVSALSSFSRPRVPHPSLRPATLRPPFFNVRFACRDAWFASAESMEISVKITPAAKPILEREETPRNAKKR